MKYSEESSKTGGATKYTGKYSKKDLGGLGKFISDDSFGNYQESTGGGTPLDKGEKLKDHPEAKRVMQPRDKEGKFTYNSVNGKTLAYGPSRGTTIPPFLRGSNAKLVQQGTIFNEMSEDKQKVAQQWMATIGMTKEELIERCKYFMEKKSARGDLSNKDVGARFADMGEGSVAKKTTFSPSATYKAGEGNTGAVAKTASSVRGNLKAITEAAKKYKGGDIPVSWLKKKTTPAPVPAQKPTPAPTPTPDNTQTGGKTGSGSGSDNNVKQQPTKQLNFDDAKNNPEKFINDNFDELNELNELAESKGISLDVDDLVKQFGEGKYKDFQSIKDLINNL